MEEELAELAVFLTFVVGFLTGPNAEGCGGGVGSRCGGGARSHCGGCGLCWWGSRSCKSRVLSSGNGEQERGMVGSSWVYLLHISANHKGY